MKKLSKKQVEMLERMALEPSERKAGYGSGEVRTYASLLALGLSGNIGGGVHAISARGQMALNRVRNARV